METVHKIPVWWYQRAQRLFPGALRRTSAGGGTLSVATLHMSGLVSLFLLLNMVF